MPDERDSQPENDPEIVIDTDWKEQVAKEREQASKPDENPEEEPKMATADSEEQPPPPPATFEVLVSMMFTQAMSMLGHIPDPTSGEASVNKPYAKHYIDTLEMLGEKTTGNLTEEESKMVSEALHALRMAYVNAK